MLSTRHYPLPCSNLQSFLPSRNNGYAISTPTAEQYRGDGISEYPKANSPKREKAPGRHIATQVHHTITMRTVEKQNQGNLRPYDDIITRRKKTRKRNRKELKGKRGKKGVKRAKTARICWTRAEPRRIEHSQKMTQEKRRAALLAPSFPLSFFPSLVLSLSLSYLSLSLSLVRNNFSSSFVTRSLLLSFSPSLFYLSLYISLVRINFSISFFARFFHNSLSRCWLRNGCYSRWRQRHLRCLQRHHGRSRIVSQEQPVRILIQLSYTLI